jgi:putative CocE/NonD family hydrolase
MASAVGAMAVLQISVGAQGARGSTRHAARSSIHMIPELRGLADRAAHLMLPMRDNVRLWTSVYFPKNLAGPAPTILIRTPYAFSSGRPSARPSVMARLLEKGYVLVYQNERGRFWSEGEFHTLTNATEDGYDTLDWITKQPWSNHKVGSLGCSSTGDSQTAMATSGHPAFAASINGASGSSIGNIGSFNEQGLFYRGGAVNMAWASWYISAGQRSFPKFPANVSPDNRDWLAEQMMMKSWMTLATEDNRIAAAMEALPVQDAVRLYGGQGATDWDDYIRREPNDPAWARMSLLRPGQKVHTPTLWLFQTHDLGVGPNLAGFEYALGDGSTPAARAHQHMIMSPLGHCSYAAGSERTMDGDREIGDARYKNIEELFIDWFDHWLRSTGPGVADLPRAQVYVPGKNSWESFREWPPATTRKAFYLSSETSAASRLGDGRLSDTAPSRKGQDTFTYDPRYPVPTIGGDGCCLPEVKGAITNPGSFDQASVELRRDVLVYTSAAIEQPLDVVGFAEVNLFVSSDARDTDFVANLVDVGPDGRALILNGSIQRARWRDGYDKPVFMRPGQVYRVRVGPFWVSNRFEPGHRIRIDITSSNFPRWDRNLNTGGRNYDESEGRIAQNTVHHDSSSPSHIVLPVVALGR